MTTERALEVSEGDISLYLNYGESLRANGNSGEASEVFQRALQPDPGNEFIAIKLAFVLVEAGQGNEVLESGLKEATKGPLLIGKAAAAADAGQITEAAQLLADASKGLDVTTFTAIIQDPVFRPHRDHPELKKFFQP